MNLKPNPQDCNVISKAFITKLLKTDHRTYYTTKQLNDVLYLHYKGFQGIGTQLAPFKGLKCLYLQGNAIKEIQGLEQLTNLRSFFIQQNLIRTIQGLSTLTLLSNLNLSDNLIERITGLQTLTKLANLQLKRNQIGVNGLDDVIGLIQCPSISAVDLSDNRIEDQLIVDEVLAKMPKMAVVYLQNNGFNKKVQHYRKTLIVKIKTLTYIDDKPIFEDERRYAQAFHRGGLVQQREQRARYKQQQQDKQVRQHMEFRAMIERHRTARAAQQQVRSDRAESESSGSQSTGGSNGESLETYWSKSHLNDSQNKEDSTSKKQDISSHSDLNNSHSEVQSHSDTKSSKGDPNSSRDETSSQKAASESSEHAQCGEIIEPPSVQQSGKHNQTDSLASAEQKKTQETTPKDIPIAVPVKVAANKTIKETPAPSPTPQGVANLDELD